MHVAFITLKASYFLVICGVCFLLGFLLQIGRVRYYREKQIRAEQEKLKMQAQMLGMGDLYDPKK